MSKSQIIVTSRYIKSGTKRSKTKRANLTKYIATRESVEKRPQNKESVTKNQTQLINDLLTEFPKAKQFLEYEDYSAKPTAENASELISTIIERYADVIGNRKNFIGYMAMRPGAEKRGAHGLFNDKDEPINLNAVANEVANHPGNVWTHVVSLRREDAVRLGYTNSDMWRELVKRHIADIAKAQNIPLANLKWYAAFHDTSHHPHIHLIVYSTNPKQGYLTNQGIEKIRSVFANDIFHDDLKSIYQQQTLTRDELKALAEDQMKDISHEFEMSSFDDPALQHLILKLKKQLDESNGKKVYGYLKKPVKETIDEIFLELSKNEHIKDLYDKWCEFEKAKYRLYTAKEIDLPPLVENNAFKPVKNMIIRTVLDMSIPEVGDGIVEESIDSEESDIEKAEIEESSEDDTPAGSTDDSSDTDDVSQEQRKKEQEALANTAMSLFLNLCSIIRNDYAQEQHRMRPKADKKLMRRIRKKEIAMGLKYDDMDMKM